MWGRALKIIVPSGSLGGLCGGIVAQTELIAECGFRIADFGQLEIYTQPVSTARLTHLT
jgi:hypothetical protein